MLRNNSLSTTTSPKIVALMKCPPSELQYVKGYLCFNSAHYVFLQGMGRVFKKFLALVSLAQQRKREREE